MLWKPESGPHSVACSTPKSQNPGGEGWEMIPDCIIDSWSVAHPSEIPQSSKPLTYDLTDTGISSKERGFKLRYKAVTALYLDDSGSLNINSFVHY